MEIKVAAKLKINRRLIKSRPLEGTRRRQFVGNSYQFLSNDNRKLWFWAESE